MPDDPRQPDPHAPRDASARAPKPGSSAWLAWIEQDAEGEGTSSEPERAAMARALAEDPALRARIEGMRADRAMLRSLASATGSDAIEPPPDLVERIELALERDALLDTPAHEPQTSRHTLHHPRHADGEPSMPHRHAPFRPRRRSGRWIAPTIALAFLGTSLWLVIERPLDPGVRPASPSMPPSATPAPLALHTEADSAAPPVTSETASDSASPGALAQADSSPARAFSPVPTDPLALRLDLEHLLAQDEAELLAARQARAGSVTMPPAVPPAPARRSPGHVIDDAARAAELARAGRLAIAIRSDRSAQLRDTFVAAARPGVGPLATLRPLREAQAIAALPAAASIPEDAQPRAQWLDLNETLAQQQPSARHPAEPEARPWSARPPLFGPPPPALGYYRLEVDPTPLALGALVDELRRALERAHADDDAEAPGAETPIIIEFIELPEPLPLAQPEVDPFWWLDATAWRPKAAVPLILTDHHTP